MMARLCDEGCGRLAKHRVTDEQLSALRWSERDGLHWCWQPVAVHLCERHARPGRRPRMATMADALACICLREAGVRRAKTADRFTAILKAGLGDLPPRLPSLEPAAPDTATADEVPA